MVVELGEGGGVVREPNRAPLIWRRRGNAVGHGCLLLLFHDVFVRHFDRHSEPHLGLLLL
jgi:hypothetical protein